MVFDKLHEECAVFGVSICEESGDGGEAAGIVYNALLALQHRGQEGAGIAVSNKNAIFNIKEVGLVNEIFMPAVMSTFPRAWQAIGHCRYSTTGSSSPDNVQPFISEYLTGRLAVSHNGNVLNAQQMRDKLSPFGIDFSASSDSEVISSLIAYKTMRGGDMFEGVKSAARLLRGAFSLVIMSGDGKLIALRDPNGYRPLCIGENKYGVAVSSESCALDSCGFNFIRDVRPGEVVLIENGSVVKSEIWTESPGQSLCIFEYVYFARPDSIVDSLSVYESRVNMGRVLAREYPVEADIVCGVPDSGLEAAMGYSIESGIRIAAGFVKNRYIGRSFIFPTQSQRENAVRIKLNPLSAAVKGKRVILVDDSIVRGTTSAKMVDIMRKAGAKEVHVRVSSPPFKHMCYFGTDIDSEENLIANQMSIDDIRKKINADTLGFISIEGIHEACSGCALGLCDACFTGKYATQI